MNSKTIFIHHEFWVGLTVHLNKCKWPMLFRLQYENRWKCLVCVLTAIRSAMATKWRITKLWRAYTHNPIVKPLCVCLFISRTMKRRQQEKKEKWISKSLLINRNGCSALHYYHNRHLKNDLCAPHRPRRASREKFNVRCISMEDVAVVVQVFSVFLRTAPESIYIHKQQGRNWFARWTATDWNWRRRRRRRRRRMAMGT